VSPDTCMQWKSVGYVMTAADYDASCINGQQNALTGSCIIVINMQVTQNQGHS